MTIKLGVISFVLSIALSLTMAATGNPVSPVDAVIIYFLLLIVLKTEGP